MSPDDGTSAEAALPPFPPEPIDSSQYENAEELSTAENVGVYRFCFSYDGRYWGTQDIRSPSTEGAAITANQLARLLQDMVRRMGYGDHVVAAYPC